MKNKLKENLFFKKKILILFFALGIIFIVGLNYFTSKYLYNGKISQNVFIEDIEVSNLTKSEALELIKSKYYPKDLELLYSNDKYIIKHKDIDLSYKIEEVVEDSYNLTRENSYFGNVISYVKAKIIGEDFVIKPSYNEEKLNNEISKVSKEINRDYTDASLNISSIISVNDSEVGLKFDDEANKKEIKKAYENKISKVDLKVDVVQPKIKTKDLKSIDTALGSFSTTFNGGLSARSSNIALALSRCNGKILMPGETFSYNEATGDRTLANGYKNAAVILNNEYEDAPGGGVCQGSTTLFNAVLLSGLEIKEVNNHTKTPKYVPRGRDAMVSGWSDFKFTNNFDHPVYISAYAGGGVAGATIYGCSKDKVSVSISTNGFTYNQKPAATTYRTIVKDGKSQTNKIYTAIYND